MEARKKHKTADVSQGLGAASTASLDVRRHRVTWRVIPHGLCAEMGWDGATVGPKGITVGCPHVACVSTCVPSDAPEQMLPSARG